MKRQAKIRYRTHDDPHAIDHMRFEDMDELAPAVLLRHMAALSDDPEVWCAWVETRDVTEWKVSAGAELLNSKGDYRMSIAAHLDHDTYMQYKVLRKNGQLEVLATEPGGTEHEPLHMVSVDGAEPKKMGTDDLKELIAGMAAGDENTSDPEEEEVSDTESS
jgi:hypothetical protein